MRLIFKPWAIAGLALVALTGVGVAVAQEGGDATPPPAGTKNVNGGQDVNISPKDMLEKVRGMIPEMDKLRASVADQLAVAKKRAMAPMGLARMSPSSQVPGPHGTPIRWDRP